MNKIIKKYLDRVKVVKLDYDDNTTQIVIPKVTQIIPEALNKGDVYIIELNERALNSNSNSTLASNWNAGRIPNHSVYKVELIDIINDMYKFNGIAIENGKELYSENWFGWFPKDYFKVIKKVEVI